MTVFHLCNGGLHPETLRHADAETVSCGTPPQETVEDSWDVIPAGSYAAGF